MNKLDFCNNVVNILKDFSNIDIILENNHKNIKIIIYVGDNLIPNVFKLGICSKDEIKQMKSIFNDFVKSKTIYYNMDYSMMVFNDCSFIYKEKSFSYDNLNCAEYIYFK